MNQNDPVHIGKPVTPTPMDSPQIVAAGTFSPEQHKILRRQASTIEQLKKENEELRLRLSLLIRLLIERGIFTTDDYSTLLQDTKTKLAQATRKPASGRPSATTKSARSDGKAPGHGPRTVVI
jgi:hypothetical protein